MERRPEFTVIAGPNGAGKSRLCPFYVSVKSFDGDKLALNLRKEHPDWPEHWISGTVASELEKRKNRILIPPFLPTTYIADFNTPWLP